MLVQAPTDELEDESEIEEFDGPFALELETRINELNSPTDEPENLAVEDEQFPSISVPLFPLSPPQAARIRVTITIPRNAICCFCFIYSCIDLGPFHVS